MRFMAFVEMVPYTITQLVVFFMEWAFSEKCYRKWFDVYSQYNNMKAPLNGFLKDVNQVV